MTAAAILDRLEARGISVTPRGESLAIRPAGALGPGEREALIALKTDILAILRGRALGVDWTAVELQSLNRVLEVSVPWSEVHLIIAPGCRVARQLRAADSKPGRVWCVCEVLDLLLTAVPPKDAQSLAMSRLAFDAGWVGARKAPAGSVEWGVYASTDFRPHSRAHAREQEKT